MIKEYLNQQKELNLEQNHDEALQQLKGLLLNLKQNMKEENLSNLTQKKTDQIINNQGKKFKAKLDLKKVGPRKSKDTNQIQMIEVHRKYKRLETTILSQKETDREEYRKKMT